MSNYSVMLSFNIDRLGIQLSSTMVSLCLSTFCYPNIVVAQIVSDETTGTQVKVTENISKIAGGTQTGQNLFHSFEQFSVASDAIAHFDNALDVNHIFSRVTGGSISEINGLIQANGNADLFLLNPAGIIFGANSSLDLGGSFIATTAESLIFTDKIEFKATDRANPPLLTVNAPLGLQYGTNTGNISISSNSGRATLDSSGLTIKPGNTLALIGGELTISRNNLNALGGNVEIGSVFSGIVELKQDELGAWQFDYSQVELFDRLNLSQTFVNSSGIVNLQGSAIALSAGSIISNFTQTNTAGGSITLQASDSITIDSSSLFTQVGQVQSDLVTAIAGSGGDIALQAPQIIFTNGSLVSAGTLSQGAGGDITIEASESMELSGGELALPTLISTSTQGSGAGGQIKIATGKLFLTDGSQIQALAGIGAGGTITVNATESIELKGTGTFLARDRQGNIVANLFNSGLSASSGNANLPGKSGSLIVNTPRLTIADGAEISVSNFGTGDAGDIKIDTAELDLTRSGKIIANTVSGKGGSIALNVERSAILQNEATISTTAQQNGNGGNIAITTDNLVLLDFNSISANAQNGSGGNITIDTRGLFVSTDSSITASSELGTDGLVDIITPDVNTKITTVVELERSPLTVENYITTGCGAGADFAKNQFRNIGRGGLPPNPTSETVIVETLEDLGTTNHKTNTTKPAQTIFAEPKTPKIIEATTWLVNQQGNIELVTCN